MTQTVPETTLLTAGRIEALFASSLSMHDTSSPEDVDRAIRETVRRLGGVRACTNLVAQECGDHPQAAVERLRWARATVAVVYAPRSHAEHRALVAA